MLNAFEIKLNVIFTVSVYIHNAYNLDVIITLRLIECPAEYHMAKDSF